jgi:AraC family L-rhamnose operon transcriptional activator RhaR
MLARLRRAATLLLNIELSIASVAELSGFSDSNYFCRIFRKNFGSSPKQYRDRR